MEKKAASEGLRWLRGRPVWRASRAAIKAGYPVKSVNLSSLANDERLLIGRAQRLQAEMRQWLKGIKEQEPHYDGTIASLLNVYQLDSESPYKNLKPSSRHPYEVYIRMLIMEVGNRQVSAIDGATSDAGSQHGRSQIVRAESGRSRRLAWRLLS